MRRLPPLVGLVCAFAPAAFSQSAPAPSEQVLFGFDDRAFPFQYGLRTELIGYHAKMVADTQMNVVMRPGPPGAPDSIGCYYYGSVQQVGSELYMWYLGSGDHDPEPLVSHLRVCFARSRDGKHWEKPALGLVEYAGTKANNLVSLDGRAFDDLVESVVIYDPSDSNPDRRFKMAFESKGRYKGRLAVAFSPDGIHWKQSPANPCGPECEMSGLIKRDGAYYVCAHAEGAWTARGEWTRSLDNIVSYDFEHWYATPALGFRRDPLPPRPITAEGSSDGEQVHLGAGLWDRGNVIVGFYGQWHGTPSDDRGLVGIDIGLVLSHDALHYYEPIPDFRIIAAKENIHHWPAVPVGPPSLAQGSGFVNIGDETLVWYGIWNIPQEGVRLATWQRDRLGYLEPFVKSSAKPTATTLPLSAESASEVFLNVSDLSDVSAIKVSILDKQFHELPGFGAADFTRPKTSGLRQKATWTSGSRIPAGKPFRIRVDFGGIRPEDVKLYAIYVTPSS